MTTTQPTSTSRQWLRKSNRVHAELERAIRAKCGRSKRKRRLYAELAASERSGESAR